MHFETLLMIAYNAENPLLYLIQNLNTCTNRKDIHWVCSSNRIIRDVNRYLCGLKADCPEQRCHGIMSAKTEEIETRVEPAGNQWLVSTAATKALLHYDHHDTAAELTLPNQTVFLRVPQGATVHIDNGILHHLDSDHHEMEINILDAFKGHNFSLDISLHQQLLVEADGSAHGCSSSVLSHSVLCLAVRVHVVHGTLIVHI